MTEYKNNPLEEIDEEERQKREAEMKKAIERLGMQKRKKRMTFISAAVGLFVGLVYVFWLIYSLTSKINGVSIYEHYMALLPQAPLVLDFLPPVILDILFTCLFLRGVPKKAYYCVTALMVTTIVITIFMVYVSYSGLL